MDRNSRKKWKDSLLFCLFLKLTFNNFIFSRAFYFVARAYKNIIIHENFPLGETVLLLSFVFARLYEF